MHRSIVDSMQNYPTVPKIFVPLLRCTVPLGGDVRLWLSKEKSSSSFWFDVGQSFLNFGMVRINTLQQHHHFTLERSARKVSRIFHLPGDQTSDERLCRKELLSTGRSSKGRPVPAVSSTALSMFRVDIMCTWIQNSAKYLSSH